jgi:hypothetical protein
MLKASYIDLTPESSQYGSDVDEDDDNVPSNSTHEDYTCSQNTNVDL